MLKAVYLDGDDDEALLALALICQRRGDAGAAERYRRRAEARSPGEENLMTASLTIVDNCWDRIGVGGDQSCPQLAEHAHCRNCPVFAAAAQTFFDRPAPADYLAEWTTVLARRQPPVNRDLLSMVIFRLHDEWLALATACLVEVTPLRPVHRVPQRSNLVFVGVVNIRGQLHLCVSLHGVLGIQPADAGPAALNASDTERTVGRQRLMVIEHRGGRWVFAVDEVLGVESVPRSVAQSARHAGQSGASLQSGDLPLAGSLCRPAGRGARPDGVSEPGRMSQDLENNPLLELFRSEAESQTAALGEGLLALERGASSPDTIESMMRAAHSLKGAARIVGLEPAVRVAHILEDYFVAVQRDEIKIAPAHVDVLLRGVDLLNQIAPSVDPGTDQGPGANEAAIAAYVAELKTLLAGGTPAPAPSLPAVPEPAPPPPLIPAPPVSLAKPSEPEAPPSSSIEPGKSAAPPADVAARTDRVVRVTAESLTRLMGLAGESLVEARQFPSLIVGLRQLKQAQSALCDHLRVLEERWPGDRRDPPTARSC